jgi:lysophospholipase L1-like esterase
VGELAVSLASLSLGPIAYAQGRRVRASLPPPCAAAGAPHGTIEPGAPATRTLHLLVIGESTVAGCGIATQEEAMPAQVARVLAAREQARVHWSGIGRIGITAARVARELEDDVAGAARADVVVIALGVNDVLTQNSARGFARDMAGVVAMVRRHHGAAAIVVAGVPPVGRFPALPQPLRGLLGWRARRLDRAARAYAGTDATVTYLPMQVESADRALFADDGFHPSAQGAALWARALVAALTTSR